MLETLDFGKEVLKANFYDSDRPYKLNFSITDRCNSRCKNCSIWKEGDRREMDLEEIGKFFSSNPFLRWISLTGGEPFLREDIDRIAELAVGKTDDLFLINIPTNGTIPGKVVEKAESIAETGVPKLYITVSVDGPRQVHNRIRGLECWDDAVETYRRLRNLSEKYSNLDTVMTFTLSRENKGLFQDTVEAVDKEIGEVSADDFSVTFQHASEHYYRNERGDRISEEEVEDIVSNFSFSLRPEKFLNLFFLVLSRQELFGNRLDCVAGKDSVFLMPDGDIYPCTVFNKKLGNLRTDGWSIPNLMDFQPKEAGCDGCWMPCEANQRILSNLPESVYRFFENYLGREED